MDGGMDEGWMEAQPKQGLLASSSLPSVILPVEPPPESFPPPIIFIVFPADTKSRRSSALVSVHFCIEKYVIFFFLNLLFSVISEASKRLFFSVWTRTRLRLQLHVLGVHDVQIFGLDDARKHVVPATDAEA